MIIQNSSDGEIVELVDQIIQDAVEKKASDIHFEPGENIFRVRFRIDGILHNIINLPVDLIANITARLKIMGQLDIAKRRISQDGRFKVNVGTHLERDCRINTCPILYGEKIVVRLLHANKKSLKIDELGMTEAQQKLFLRYLKFSQGMILVTGPTGSGKTVTLYAALNELNTEQRNIITAEDPVEISLAGINQVNVDIKIGFGFSAALRTFLRQDPDVIMVGEIRDRDTVQVAIKAAQTGHLVLATLHTNDTVASITRLLNMGVENFNIASTVKLIISQRLLRKKCPFCELAGCEHCNKGYLDRIAIFEMLGLDENITHLIVKNAKSSDIFTYARNNGLQTLREIALQKVNAGITSLEEVNRVI